MSNPLKVMTYNIHGFVGRDNNYSPERILQILEMVNADIIALQEVQADQPNLIQKLKFFAKQKGYNLVLGPTILAKMEHLYGNAMFFRGTAIQQQLFDISQPTREPRSCIELYLMIHNEKWRIVATHLGLSPTERRQQIKVILRILAQDSMNTILLGDLNEWLAWGKPLRWLKKHFEFGHVHFTFPSYFPVLSLDRIWVHPHHRVTTTYTVRNKLTRIASDHLPLIAEISTY